MTHILNQMLKSSLVINKVMRRVKWKLITLIRLKLQGVIRSKQRLDSQLSRTQIINQSRIMRMTVEGSSQLQLGSVQTRTKFMDIIINQRRVIRLRLKGRIKIKSPKVSHHLDGVRRMDQLERNNLQTLVQQHSKQVT